MIYDLDLLIDKLNYLEEGTSPKWGKMNSVKMIPGVLCDVGKVLIKQGEHDQAIDIFNKSFKLSSSFNSYIPG
mgnify:CR=1 FL=1